MRWSEDQVSYRFSIYLVACDIQWQIGPVNGLLLEGDKFICSVYHDIFNQHGKSNYYEYSIILMMTIQKLLRLCRQEGGAFLNIICILSYYCRNHNVYSKLIKYLLEPTNHSTTLLLDCDFYQLQVLRQNLTEPNPCTVLYINSILLSNTRFFQLRF